MNQKKTFKANLLLGYAVLVGLLVACAALFGPASAFADDLAVSTGATPEQMETPADAYNLEAPASSEEPESEVQWVTFAGWAVIAVVVVGIGVSIFVRVRKNK
ncbi:MAG: hypothetical protein HFJ66_05635 [Eggerthellaceae bacterium]|nr:hypothetical protein [Eggerthellaceae bacterium]